jgi:hypothetical protein
MLKKGGFQVAYKGIGKPIQVPMWQEHVGQYFQYPSPFWMDPKRIVGRSAAYYASLAGSKLRRGAIGALAPNIVAIARLRSTT